MRRVEFHAWINNFQDAAMIDLLKRCNDADLSQLSSLKIINKTFGHVRPKLAETLRLAEPVLFTRINEFCIKFNVNVLSSREITDRVAVMHATLAAEGILPKPADEFTDVRAQIQDPPQFQINRNLIFPLGIKSWGVHLILTHANGDFVVARRSNKVFTFRGCYDVPVGGLLPSGKDPWTYVMNEASEEAGLPPDAVRAYGEATVLTYARNVQGQWIDGEYKPAFPFETDGGTNWDEVFYWPSIIADDIVLKPRDGEVKSFLRMTPEELIHSLKYEPCAWKTNSGVMFVDMLARNPLFNHHFSAEDHAYLQRLRIVDQRRLETRGELPISGHRPGWDEQGGSSK